MSFADLKKQSKFGFEKLSQEIEKLQNPVNGNGDDSRLWKPNVDKSGNGYAVFRFLPAADGDDLPWMKVWHHGFQGPGGWLIDNCPTTLSQKCPVCEFNTGLWNSGIESDKEIARKQKRKLNYYSNIYVVSDPSNPENNGKVFLYKYGKKIFDKIQEAMKPEFEDETPINIFDFWQGADFKLKIKKVAGYWNYDSSEFTSPSTLGGFDDSELEKVWRNEYSLQEFVNPSAFKSYDELQTRLNVVLSKNTSRIDRETLEDEDDFDTLTPPRSSRPVFNSVANTVTREPSLPKVVAETADEDDTLSYFARLAEED
ncbi:single-stranded DNA-binding protein [bacterium]|nr:single-stranded DNA-binding protein [bacterium]